MSVFVIAAISSIPTLAHKIEANYAGNFLMIRDGLWLVSGPPTAQAVSDTIGITPGDIGSAIVFGVDGYFGRAPTAVWDWIKAKQSA